MTVIARPKTEEQTALARVPSDTALMQLCTTMVKQGGLPNRADGKPWTPDAAWLVAKAAQSYGILDPAAATRAFYFSKAGQLDLLAAFELDCIFSMYDGACFIWVDEECTWDRAVAMYKRPEWPTFPMPRDVAAGERAVGYKQMLALQGWHEKKYTLADAEREGFMKPGRTKSGESFTTTWQKFTRRMLRWNLVRELSKEAFPEVRFARDRAVATATRAHREVTERYPSITGEPDPADLAITEPAQIEQAVDDVPVAETPDLGFMGEDAALDQESGEASDLAPADLAGEAPAHPEGRERDIAFIRGCWSENEELARRQREVLIRNWSTDDLERLDDEVLTTIADGWQKKLAGSASNA
jgi:hypothetical protein